MLADLVPDGSRGGVGRNGFVGHNKTSEQREKYFLEKRPVNSVMKEVRAWG